MQLSKNAKVVSVMNAQAAGSTNVDGTSVDMQGYDCVMFIAHLGTLSATQVTKLEAKGSSDNSVFAQFATDAVTAAMADTDSNKCLVLDIYRPVTRYVRPTLQRATANAVIDSIIAILYQADHLPFTADTSLSQLAAFASP